jgi:hypothetical protein
MWLIAFALASTQFQDLPPNNSAYPAVQYLVDHGVVKGYENNQFQPDRKLTRAEALKISLLASGQPVPTTAPTEAQFTDVPTDHWAAPYVSAGVAQGIIKGYEDQTFRPDQTISRQEGIKVLFSSFQITPPEASTQAFSDVGSDSWFFNYATYLKQKNLWLTDSSTFGPEVGFTRAEIAKVAYQLATRQQAATLPIVPIWGIFVIIILWLSTSLISVRLWRIWIKQPRLLWLVSIITAPLASSIYCLINLIPSVAVRHTDGEEEHKNPIYLLLKPRKLGLEFFQYFAVKFHALVLASIVFLINFLLGNLLFISYSTYVYKQALS